MTDPSHRVLTTLRVALAALLLLAGTRIGAAAGPAGGGGPPAAGAPAPPPGTFWKMASGYEVVLDPFVDVECHIFQSPDFQRLLLVAEKTDVAFLLDLKSHRVSTLPSSAVVPQLNGLILPNGVSTSPAGIFVQKGADLSFKVGEGSVLISPRPPLVGEVTLKTILETKKEYAAAARAYTPGPEGLAALRDCRKSTEIVVFFGTWCPHCRKWMPAFLRTMELAGNPRLTVRYIAVDEELNNPHDEIWKYNAHVVPTFIVLRGGKELGRIRERPMKTIEQDLAEILINNP